MYAWIIKPLLIPVLKYYINNKVIFKYSMLLYYCSLVDKRASRAPPGIFNETKFFESKFYLKENYKC